MKKVKILTGFLHYTQTKLLQKAHMILLCITNNVNFPAPTPTLTDLGKAVNDYSEALANPGSKANTALKGNCVSY